MMTTTMNMMKRIAGFFTAAVMTTTMAVTTLGGALTAGATEEVSHKELRSMANEIAIMVNEARAEAGLPALYVVPYLNEVADERAVECVISFAHTRLDGSRYTTAIDKEEIPFVYSAENIAAGSDNAEDTFDQWRNSPSHWKAIMSEKTTHMGIGVVYDEDSEYGWYWQQTFVKVDGELEGQYLPTEYEIVPQAEGDLNGDAVVDAYDYLILADYIYKKKTDVPVFLNEAQLQTADCFRDGIITEADAKVMVRYLLGEYKTLPYEF